MALVPPQFPQSLAAVDELSHRMALLCAGIPDRLLREDCRAPVKHADETGWWTNGYNIGMRKSEILKLMRDRVDLKTSIIRLRLENTNTEARRVIPLTKELSVTLKKVTI